MTKLTEQKSSGLNMSLVTSPAVSVANTAATIALLPTSTISRKVQNQRATNIQNALGGNFPRVLTIMIAGYVDGELMLPMNPTSEEQLEFFRVFMIDFVRYPVNPSGYYRHWLPLSEEQINALANDIKPIDRRLRGLANNLAQFLDDEYIEYVRLTLSYGYYSPKKYTFECTEHQNYLRLLLNYPILFEHFTFESCHYRYRITRRRSWPSPYYRLLPSIRSKTLERELFDAVEANLSGEVRNLLVANHDCRLKWDIRHIKIPSMAMLCLLLDYNAFETPELFKHVFCEVDTKIKSEFFSHIINEMIIKNACNWSPDFIDIIGSDETHKKELFDKLKSKILELVQHNKQQACEILDYIDKSTALYRIFAVRRHFTFLSSPADGLFKKVQELRDAVSQAALERGANSDQKNQHKRGSLASLNSENAVTRLTKK